MKIEDLGQPCRNFNFLGIEKIVDPKDGKEKVVFSNFASGGTGSIILLDPATGAGETLVLPGDEGAWAVLNWNNEKLLVGTCSGFGYLHCLDLKTRTWAAPLRDPGENYIWLLCRGSDGMVYGGTYPGCVLLRYDPARHVLENMGRVSDAKDNLYSRMVYGGIPGHILVECGTASPHLALWSMETRIARPFGAAGARLREITSEFVCTETNGKLEFYDLKTLEPIGRDLSARLTPPEEKVVPGMSFAVRLANGARVATRGQEYVCIAEKGAKPIFREVPSERPPTGIHTLVSDERGKIWGASQFGQTIFSYEPKTGQVWNSGVVCNAGGEVYGMAFSRGRLFMSAYCGGDHIVYDPGKPWDQFDNVNPVTLKPVGPALIRPSGKSVLGPDGHVWTGWMAQYGMYGGGISRINVKTLEVDSWLDPIPTQAIASIAADERFIYFTTNGEANGLASAKVQGHFVVWDISGRIQKDVVMPPDEMPGLVAAVGGRILLSVPSKCELRVFNPRTMAFEGSIPLGGGCSAMVKMPDDTAAVFAGKKILRVAPATRTVSAWRDTPGGVHAAAVTPQGGLYFGAELQLYRVAE